MGNKITKVQFIPGKNEQLETTIMLEKEARSVIHGIVLDQRKCPVQDAVVKLFLMPDKDNCCNLIPITHTFTDECGQFLFGPLPPCKRYVVKVWHDAVKPRKIPGKHFTCKSPCTPCKDFHPPHDDYDSEEDDYEVVFEDND